MRNCAGKIGAIAGLFIVMVFSCTYNGYGQGMAPEIKFNPKRYVSHKITDSLLIDGRLNESAWSTVRWTDKFTDIQGGSARAPRYETRVKMLWDNSYLYIGARMEEPHIWATLTERDAVIFHNNNFEVFVDPDGDTHQYYELEVNALGTFWDLMLTQPYRDGGKAIDSWDMRELEIGIQIEGTINDPSDTDTAWTVELAIPWKDLAEASADGEKPSIGDQWRINFSRVEWRIKNSDGTYVKERDESGEVVAEDNWVWSPQGVINMHYPEMWGFVQFAGERDQAETFEWNDEEYIKWYLRQLYYRQHDFRKKHGRFAAEGKSLEAEHVFYDLNLDSMFPSLSSPHIFSTPQTFEIRMRDEQSGKTWYVRENGHIWSTPSSRKE